MRMIADNERLNIRIEEREKFLAQRKVTRMSVSYASVAGKGVCLKLRLDRSRRVCVSE